MGFWNKVDKVNFDTGFGSMLFSYIVSDSN